MVCFPIGIILHLSLFRHGEWDLYTTKLVVALAATQALLTYYLMHYQNDGPVLPLQALTAASKFVFTLMTGVFSSILVYRMAFHRLNTFPGPFVARLSNLFGTSLWLKNYQVYNEIQKLHNKYGDYVRVGPSELSIADPKAFRMIHSNNSPCVKGPWYNVLQPMVSLQMIRNKQEHSRRRKIWDKALNTKALRDYEPRVTLYTSQLLSQVEKMEGKPFNVTKWFNFYTFDIMGDLAFGRSFDMLKSAVTHYYMELAHANMLLIGAFSRLVWLFPLFKSIPGLNYAHIQFQQWLTAQVEQRRKNKPEVRDVFSWILDDYESINHPTKQDLADLHGDANLIVVAGSDTTAASLTALFYQLALHPDVCKTLQDEIDGFKGSNDASDHSSLAKLKFLQACIDESLRLSPAVPSGVQRMTPPKGLQVGDTFIPGNTIIQLPSYTMYRDDRAFAQPNMFVPERWTTKPDLVKEPSVYAPFSTGRYSCVGKQLGLMEMRSVTFELLSRYDVSFVRDYSPKSFVDGMRDYFTLALPDLELVFTSRK
ncbi:benzoate 4-monooxygenase cytochrome P450 [Thelonectria olida]|uniref:Benzoate 4-monooxygenase cytochrome P450 n=1 Tax=Thelonectria olida TaxID=1576542 RepID=A0A9P8VVH5_9HYPO|nr:benzoate 4-monooxygenase cytochrome P450 [Thelonectria olida]